MKTAAPDRFEGQARRRRFWSDEEKRRFVAELDEPGASASTVAQRHDLNANLLFTWRRQFRRQSNLTQTGGVTLVPVSIAQEPSASTGRMEIVLAGGEHILVGADVDAGALARVVKALSRR
jgi:transposase